MKKLRHGWHRAGPRDGLEYLEAELLEGTLAWRSMISKSLFEQKKLWLQNLRFRDRGQEIAPLAQRSHALITKLEGRELFGHGATGLRDRDQAFELAETAREPSENDPLRHCGLSEGVVRVLNSCAGNEDGAAVRLLLFREAPGFRERGLGTRERQSGKHGSFRRPSDFDPCRGHVQLLTRWLCASGR